MRKALSLATFTLLVLGLVACNHKNDITGINAEKGGSTSALAPTSGRFKVGPEALATVTILADRSRKVATMAPNQPAPIPHTAGVTLTQMPTPTSLSRRGDALKQPKH